LTYNLAVRSPFRTYKRGDLITDQAVVRDVLSGEDHVHVVKVAADPGAATGGNPQATGKGA
jgi:hypothetical protein